MRLYAERFYFGGYVLFEKVPAYGRDYCGQGLEGTASLHAYSLRLLLYGKDLYKDVTDLDGHVLSTKLYVHPGKSSNAGRL